MKNYLEMKENFGWRKKILWGEEKFWEVKKKATDPSIKTKKIWLKNFLPVVENVTKDCCFPVMIWSDWWFPLKKFSIL